MFGSYSMSIFLKMSAIASAIALSLFSSFSYASTNTQTPVQVAELDPIVITASRSEEKLSTIPARVTVINTNDVTKNPTLNLSDTLKKDASIYIKQNGGVGQGTELYLRGGLATHTLLLKDGARLNTQNSFSPLYPETLDLTDVSQIEIVKGASSVQYGTDAISGVIQLRSAIPQKTSAFVTGVYGENDTYKAIIGADLVQNGFYAQLRGQKFDTDGTRVVDTQDHKEKAGFDQKGYNAKLGYKQDNLHANVSFAENKGTNIYMNYMTAQNTEQRQFKNQTLSTQVEYQPIDNLTLNAQYAQTKDTQTWVDGSTTPYTPHNKNTDSNVNAKWQFTPQQNVLVGIAHQTSAYSTNANQADQQKIKSTGYYLQHQYKGDVINSQVGVRVEDNDRFGQHTVGQGAIRYQFLPNTSIFANVGSSFKAPFLGQLYSIYGGNTELQPEKGLSYELGLDHKLNENATAYLSLYQNKVDNLISHDAQANKQMNIDKAQFTGGELGVKWAKDDLFLSSEYAYVKTENKSGANNGKELPYRPKQTLTFTAGLENADYGVSTSLIAYDKSYTDRANSKQMAGYATIDVNAHWNVNPYIKLFTNIQNIGDVEHRVVDNFGNWYINGGRQANVGVTFKY